MIVRRKPAESLPRGLAWGLFIVGAVLLALRPGWAQGEAGETEPSTPEVVAGPSSKPRVADPVAAAPAAPAPKRPRPGRGVPSPEAPPPPVQPGGESELLKAQLEIRFAELQEARAQLDRLRLQLDQTKKLFDQRVVAQGEVELAQADLAAQQARVRAREAQVKEAQLRLINERNKVTPDLRTPPPGLPVMPPVPPTPSGAGAEERLRQLEHKLEGLLQEVESLRKQLQRDGAGQPERVPPPPPKGGGTTSVKGVITKIDGQDKGLVLISIGSDAGLARGHTVEVYRLKPRPQYLGQLRIVEVRPGGAVGRVSRPAVQDHQFQVGDLIATELSSGD